MNVSDSLRTALRGHLSAISIDSVLQRHLATPTLSVQSLSVADRDSLARSLEVSTSLFSTSSPGDLRRTIRKALALDEGTPAAVGNVSIRVPVQGEVDVSVARNEARRIATDAGLSASTSVKIATSVSELARNIVLYATRGTIDLSASVVRSAARGAIVIDVVAKDDGPGIDATIIDAILGGRYRSKSGLGKGIVAVKRIADEFELDSVVGRGTTVRLRFRGHT